MQSASIVMDLSVIANVGLLFLGNLRCSLFVLVHMCADTTPKQLNLITKVKVISHA